MFHLSEIRSRNLRARTSDKIFMAMLAVAVTISTLVVNTAACVALVHG